MTQLDPREAPIAYETWVRALRAFAADPMTPIDHLPPLQDETYTPDTYRRLIGYLERALDSVTQRWVDGLQRTWNNARTPFELAQGLTQLRVMLARRVQLARHPSLPPTLRDTLERDLRDSVARYQRELEDNVRKGSDSASLEHEQRERMLAVVRENSFLRVLEYQVSFDGRAGTTGPIPQADMPPASKPAAGMPPTQSRWAHRRLSPPSDHTA